MGRIAELDLSIKESFVDKLEAICRNRGWDSDSDFEDVVESIYNFGSIGCAEDLIDYAKDAWIGNTLFAIVSKGKNLWLVPIEVDGAYYGWNEITGMDEDIARAMILYTGRPNTSFKYDYSDTVEAHKVISAVREDGVALTNNTYLPDDVEVVITISLGMGE